MLDSKAFRSISYGLYLISSHSGGVVAGCTVNTFAQLTSKPFQVSVTMNKENRTTQIIQKSGMYTAVSLSEHAPMELIGTFGFQRSHEINKFESFLVEYDSRGIPHVKEHVLARFAVKVTQEIDLGTHCMFIGDVEEAEVFSNDKPMTYAYYHEVKGGKTPPRASSYIPDIDGAEPTKGVSTMSESAEETATTPRYAWRCTVCGHIEEVDELPDDFVCPVCGVGKDMFERIEL